MRDRTKNRSDRYQALFAELPYSNDMMAEFVERDGEGDILSDEQREALLDAKEDLRQAFWRIVETELTDRQKEVIKLHCEGYTQTEIAKELNVNQSSITKSINGNCDYKNGKRVYGGAKRKIARIAEKDPEVIEILKRINEISSL